MDIELVAHRAHPPSAVERVVVGITRPDADRLILRYTLWGAIDGIVVPAPAPAARTDELWRTTCFEAFVRAPGEADYLEFNFAPSSRWAAYAFDGYRAGMRAAALGDAPQIAVTRGARALTLDVTLRAPLAATSNMLGLSAVIEEAGGGKSYWAIRHPEGPADFHHDACFALELAAPRAA